MPKICPYCAKILIQFKRGQTRFQDKRTCPKCKKIFSNGSKDRMHVRGAASSKLNNVVNAQIKKQLKSLIDDIEKPKTSHKNPINNATIAAVNIDINKSHCDENEEANMNRGGRFEELNAHDINDEPIQYVHDNNNIGENCLNTNLINNENNNASVDKAKEEPIIVDGIDDIKRNEDENKQNNDKDVKTETETSSVPCVVSNNNNDMSEVMTNDEQLESISSNSNDRVALSKCVFCAKTFTINDHPKLLECLHVSCAECVDTKFVNSDGFKTSPPQVHCTVCKIGLHKEYIVDNYFLVEECIANENSVSDGSASAAAASFPCSGCSDNAIATSWCSGCSEFICSNCVQSHQRLKIFKDHVIKPMDDTSGNDQLSHIDKVHMCQVHPRLKLSLYCETCDQVTCRDCQLGDHRLHNYQLAQDMAPATRQSLHTFLTDVKSKRYLLSYAEKVLDDRQTEVTNKRKNLLNEITVMVMEVLRTVTQCRDQLVKRVNEACDNKMNMLSEKVNSLQPVIENMDHSIQFMGKALENGSDIAILSCQKLLVRHMQKLQLDILPDLEDPVQIQMKLVKTMDLPKLINCLGTVLVDGKPHSPAISNSVNDNNTVAQQQEQPPSNANQQPQSIGIDALQQISHHASQQAAVVGVANTHSDGDLLPLDTLQHSENSLNPVQIKSECGRSPSIPQPSSEVGGSSVSDTQCAAKWHTPPSSDFQIVDDKLSDTQQQEAPKSLSNTDQNENFKIYLTSPTTLPHTTPSRNTVATRGASRASSAGTSNSDSTPAKKSEVGEEDPIAKKRRLANERKARWMARQSQDSLERIKAKQAETQRRRREKETSPERAARRAADVASHRRAYKQMTPEQQEQHRLAHAESQARYIQRMNQSQKEAYRIAHSVSQLKYIERMSAEQRLMIRGNQAALQRRRSEQTRSGRNATNC